MRFTADTVVITVVIFLSALTLSFCIYVFWIINTGTALLSVSDSIQVISTLILVVSILIAFYSSQNAFKGLKNQIWLSVFSEYTKRYSDIIIELPVEASNTERSALPAFRNEIMGLMRAYYDLCSEQYYLYRAGRIDSQTWGLWSKGFTYTIRLPTFRDAWDLIKGEAYDDDFIKYVETHQAIV